MTTSNLSLQITLSTQDIQANYTAQHPQKQPMNNHSKKNRKMEAIYEEMEDKTMEEMTHNSSSTGPKQTSTRLAAKLKKLMDTKPNQVLCPTAMEIKAKEQKKQARVITLAGVATNREQKDYKMAAPDIKKLRNNETPP